MPSSSLRRGKWWINGLFSFDTWTNLCKLFNKFRFLNKLIMETKTSFMISHKYFFPGKKIRPLRLLLQGGKNRRESQIIRKICDIMWNYAGMWHIVSLPTPPTPWITAVKLTRNNDFQNSNKFKTRSKKKPKITGMVLRNPGPKSEKDDVDRPQVRLIWPKRGDQGPILQWTRITQLNTRFQIQRKPWQKK